MKFLILIILANLFAYNLTHARSLTAKSVTKDFDALAENQEIIERVKNLNSEKKVQIVQNRLVDRNLRLELGVQYGLNTGGDSYVDTDALSGQLEFHITPKWSLGARYNKYYNELTSEGRAQLERAKTAASDIPQIDYPLSSALATISFYPIYGKLNLFNLTTAQFDIYFLAGAGQIQLRDSSSGLYTAGGGVGLWISQHISGRLEARYQSYKDTNQTRTIDSVALSAGLGFLF